MAYDKSKGSGHRGNAVLIVSPDKRMQYCPSWKQAAAKLGLIARYLTRDKTLHVNEAMIREGARFSKDKTTYKFPEDTPLHGWQVVEVMDDDLAIEAEMKSHNIKRLTEQNNK